MAEEEMAEEAKEVVERGEVMQAAAAREAEVAEVAEVAGVTLAAVEKGALMHGWKRNQHPSSRPADSS